MQIPAILNYFVPIYPNYEILVWNKTNPSPTINNTWLPDIEYCLYFRGKGVQLSGIYDYSSKWFTSAINKKDKDLYDHPTIKPLDLVVRHLQNTTRCGAVILDPFIGSGTTAVAAKMIGAKYIGFEINVKYFRVANDRLNEITQIERRYKNNGCMTIFDFINDDET